MFFFFFFFFSSRRRHTRWTGDWSSDVCSSDLVLKDGFPDGFSAQQQHFHGRPMGFLRRLRGHRDPVTRTEHRSEERRVGKEGRARWPRYHEKKKEKNKGKVRWQYRHDERYAQH